MEKLKHRLSTVAEESESSGSFSWQLVQQSTLALEPSDSGDFYLGDYGVGSDDGALYKIVVTFVSEGANGDTNVYLLNPQAEFTDLYGDYQHTTTQTVFMNETGDETTKWTGAYLNWQNTSNSVTAYYQLSLYRLRDSTGYMDESRWLAL